MATHLTSQGTPNLRRRNKTITPCQARHLSNTLHQHSRTVKSHSLQFMAAVSDKLPITSKGLMVLSELAFQVCSFKHMLTRVDRPEAWLALSSMKLSLFRIGTGQTYDGLGSQPVATMTVKLKNQVRVRQSTEQLPVPRGQCSSQCAVANDSRGVQTKPRSCQVAHNSACEGDGGGSSPTGRACCSCHPPQRCSASRTGAPPRTGGRGHRWKTAQDFSLA